MSDQWYEGLELLNKKLEVLFDRYNNLKSENARLTGENESIRRDLQDREKRIEDLETKYERIKLSGALMGEGSNAIEAKRKINELVREIDRCVALLNR